MAIYSSDFQIFFLTFRLYFVFLGFFNYYRIKTFLNTKFFLIFRPIMKKYPKIVQSDDRGQIVIPKEVRRALGIEDGTGFFVYAIEGEGILLKKIDEPDLENSDVMKQLEDKADKLKLDKKALKKTAKKYKRTKKGGLEVV